jgi:hypothetical protein
MRGSVIFDRVVEVETTAEVVVDEGFDIVDVEEKFKNVSPTRNQPSIASLPSLYSS